MVKCVSYRARQSLLRERKQLRNTEGMKDVFINEDLTSNRSKLLFDARPLVKAKVLKSAYSADGRKLVKVFADKRYLIQNELTLIDRPDQSVGAARAYCACSGCGWGLFGHFYSRLSFLCSFSLSLGDGPI